MKLYLVTGTTKGLGAALYEVLRADAENVVFSMSRFALQDRTNAKIFIDLSDLATIEPTFEKFLAQIAGKIFDKAVLINNAGIVAPVAPFNAIDASALKLNLDVNLLAPMILMRLFANATRTIAKERLILNISSGAAKRPISGWAGYCTAKAGLEMATRAASLESAAADPALSVCALAPGVIDTPMQGQIRDKNAYDFPDVERFRAMKNDGTLRAAKEVARDIVSLIDSGRLTNGGIFDIREMLQTQ